MIARHLPRFRKAYQALETLAAREQWTRKEIESYQLARLNEVWQHAVAYVPYYRHLAAHNRLPARFDSLDQYRATVPVLPKSRVKEQKDQFLSERPHSGSWRRTGGSTGTPMSCYWSNEAHLEMLRTKYRFYQMWGIDIFDPVAYLWGHSASFLPGLSGRIARLKQPIEDRIRNRLRLSAYNLGRDDLRDYLRQIAAFRPVSLYGYSRALAFLGQEAETEGFECDSLKLAVLTGEPAFPNLVDTVQRAFRIPAVVEYGSIECGAIASEWTDRTLRVREDVNLVETMPREDGRHDIVVTVLNNPSFPLLRYAIADVTDEPLQTADRGFATLKNVVGRNNDFVLTKGGRYLHSARFDAFFKYENPNIKRFRVRQRHDGSLSVLLELDHPSQSVNVESIGERLRLLVEGYPVKVEVVERIEQTAAGKHRLVTSELGDAATAPARASASATESGAPIRINGSAPRVRSERTEELVPPPRRYEKATLLRQLITSPQLSFLMEAHNGLSAKIAEEAGFEALWASGLSISAALGVRDSNEASWTQVIEVLEFMSDATRIPILVDGDTGHGNFNNMRRFVRKLEQRRIGGVCIEDKLFPKTNSFVKGTAQPLADVDEFCGKIKAGKDAQESDDFVIVARVEAFIAGWGLEEALRRAESYHAAGADAILMHSALRSPKEIISFLQEWGGRSPVVLVPTKYYTTPTDVFRDHGVNAVIWANHLMRCCITAMQRTAQEIFEDQTLINIEDRVASVSEVFRLQGQSELSEAEDRYLPVDAGKTKAIVLAASRGHELGELTTDRPKCMIPIAGEPILARIAASYREAGVRDITVVRGYRKDAVDLEDLSYVDNDEATSTKGVYSLYKALPVLQGDCIVSYGDVLFKKYIAQQLMDVDADFAIAVDAAWKESRNADRYAEYVHCDQANLRKAFYQPAKLLRASADLPRSEIHGEWMGFLKVSTRGAQFLREHLERIAQEHPERLKQMSLLEMLDELAAVHDVRVVYSTGHWLDIDSVEDVLAGGAF
jgi:phosphoenolpyruvate phosphomutase